MHGASQSHVCNDNDEVIMKLHITLLLSALGATALPVAQAAQFEEYGRVIRSEPRREQIRQPREECRTEYVQAPAQYAQPQRNAGGAIIGAIAGGILGNQVGGGSGRAAATALGAVAGAVTGDRLSNNNRPGEQYAQSQYPQEQAVRQCRMIDAYESRTTGYDVTYDYRGRSYTTFVQRDPGERIRLRVTVEPDQY
jgi:uncharacterized protein YcfJ